jgi:hypothetical protein
VVVGPSLVSAWTVHRLEDVGVGAVSAGRAEKIALEVRERLLDLGEIPPPGTSPAPVAHGRAPGDALGGDDVRAMLVRREAPALAAVALGTGPRPDLVHVAGVGAGGDEPTAAALVAGEDVVGVELVQTEAAEDVGGFGGGGVLHLRYTGVDHGGSFPVVRAPGWTLTYTRGAIPFDTRIISLMTQYVNCGTQYKRAFFVYVVLVWSCNWWYP